MDGVSSVAWSFHLYEEEKLEHFLEKSSGELKYFLQQRRLPVGGTHSSLAAIEL